MTSFRRLLARRSLIRLLIFIPLTWLLFSLMYSFHGRSSLPYSFRNAPAEEAPVFPDIKPEKLLQDNQKNNEENEVDRPLRAHGGKHKHHSSDEVRAIRHFLSPGLQSQIILFDPFFVHRKRCQMTS